MLALESSVFVYGITGSEVTAFLLNPTDEQYRAWWPGTHLQSHVVVAGAQGREGDVVWMVSVAQTEHDMVAEITRAGAVAP